MAPRLRILAALAITASLADAQTVRVRLLADAPPTAATVEALAGPLTLEVDGRTVTGREVRLQARDGEVEATGPGTTARGRDVRLSGGPFLLRTGTVARTYLGDLSVAVRDGRLELINGAPLEDYVASVVASEYPFEEIEGIKAQAVIARTYALRRRAATPRYDLDDHQGSQVYRGEGVVTERARRAARETAGEVVTYAGALAETPYFSSSGGHTANNEAVWAGAPLPYLRGVADPADRDAPDHRWTTSAPRRAVEDALSRRLGGRARGVEVAERSPSGRVVTLRVEGGRRATISGSDFRTLVNGVAGARTVRSTQFDLRVEGDRYVFEGRGFGHGVGMSQYGARGLARQGWTYREILAHYFAGTTLHTPAGPAIDTPPPPLAASSPASEIPAARPRTWPVPRGTARDAAPAPRRTGW